MPPTARAREIERRPPLRSAASLARATWIICSLAAVAIPGCAASSRKDAPHVGDGAAVPVGVPGTVRISDDSRSAFEARAPKILAQIREAAGSGRVNILALSGGGVGAAFGAGALIAPFAFLGPGWDDKLTDIFSGMRTQHLLQWRWLGALLGTSVYRGKPLFDLVDRYVTPDLLQAVAAEAAKGRRLMIASNRRPFGKRYDVLAMAGPIQDGLKAGP